MPADPEHRLFHPSLLAAKQGGLGLVFGMTIAAGFLQMALSRTLRRLRPVFPPEIIGIVILLVGIATGLVDCAPLSGKATHDGTVGAIELAIGFVSLDSWFALNVWGGAFLSHLQRSHRHGRGYVVAALSGSLHPPMCRRSRTERLSLPGFAHLSWSFDAAYLLPFAVAAVAATLKVMGNVATLDKASDADWVRTDMRKVSRGVLSDGMGTVVAGMLGVQGLNSSPAVVGFATASGVLSRRVGYAAAAVARGPRLPSEAGRSFLSHAAHGGGIAGSSSPRLSSW